MAQADGEIIIDTLLETEGLEYGSKTILQSLKKIEKILSGINTSVLKFCNSFIDGFGASADSAGKLGRSLKDSKKDIEDFRKEAEKITITRMDEYKSDGYDGPLREPVEMDPKFLGYSSDAISKVEEYAQSTGEASDATNDFKESIESARRELSKLEETGMYFGDEEYDNAYLKLQQVMQALEDYKKMLVDPPANANPFGLDTISGKIVKAEQDLSRLIDAGKGLGDADYDKTYRTLQLMKAEAKSYAAELSKTPEQVQKEEAKLNAMNQKFEETRAKEVAAIMEAKRLREIGDNASVSREDIVALNRELQELELRQSDLKNAGLGLGYEEFDKNASRISEINARLKEYEDSLSGASSKTEELAQKTKGLGRIFSGMGASIKKAAAAVLGLDKRTKNAQMSMGRMLAMSLMFSAVFRAISLVTSGIGEGMSNLAQYSGSTNAAISSLISALTQLKNSFATAFSPILTTVAPLLTSFISMISKAITYVGMFIAALTGQKTFTKAVAVQEDYAASLGDTASQAKEAEKALEGYLSPLDEINRYEEASSGGGIDTPAGGGGYTGPAIGDMFETVPIESSIKGIADKIRKLIENEDWEGLGAYIAQGINAGMAKIKEVISWENVGPEVTYFVTAFTSTLNSLVDNIDWNLMGETLGTGINTLVNTLLLLITGIDWVNIGMAFATGLNGMVATVDWYNVGLLIGSYFMIAWNTFYGFVSTLDWAQVGLAIANAINGAIQSIDLATVGASISAFVIGLLTAFTTAVQNTDWKAVGQEIADMLKAIDWVGLAKQLWSAGTSLVSGLLEAFGQLPAPVQAIITLFAGFMASSKLASIISFVTGTAAPGIKGFISLLTGGGGIKAAIGTIAKVLGSGSPLALAITAAVGLIALLIANWDDVKAAMEKFDKFLTDIFTKDWSEQFGVIGEVMNGLFKSLGDVWDDIKKLFNSIIKFVKDVFKGDWDAAWSDVKDIFKTIWDTFSDIVKTPINAIIGLINGLLSGVQTMQNGIAGALNNLHVDVPQWVTDLTGITGIGFNLSYWTAPQIPYLATGAVIPPNQKFLAVLGDQKSGTNIETPEALLRKIFREENARAAGNGGNYQFTAQLNRRTIFDEFITEAKLRQMQSGQNPFDLA